LLEEEGYCGGMLENAAGRGGGCSGDCYGVAFGGEGEGVCGVDAVSAAGSGEQREASEGDDEELRCKAVIAGAKNKSCDGR
jgi:hypothetical protein